MEHFPAFSSTLTNDDFCRGTLSPRQMNFLEENTSRESRSRNVNSGLVVA